MRPLAKHRAAASTRPYSRQNLGVAFWTVHPKLATAPASCSGFPEFSVLSQGVTAACCGAGVECPPGGIPTTCTEACAAVLLPMQAACANVLAEIGMAETVAAAVATCPTQCAPPPVDTRSADCKAADIDDETKAALCRGEPQSRCSLRRS